MKGIITSIASAILLSGCYGYEESTHNGCHLSITISQDDARSDYPSFGKAREIDNAGKIYVYGDTLFVLEKGQGLHVVNNADKSNPVNTSFIKMVGNTDLAVKDAHLYVDSFTDLVVMDINNLDNIKTVHRKEDIFPYAPNDSLSDADKAKYHCYDTNGDDQLIIGYE